MPTENASCSCLNICCDDFSYAGIKVFDMDSMKAVCKLPCKPVNTDLLKASTIVWNLYF